MNSKLTEQIIRHVYNCLGIKLPNKINSVHSIMQPEYLLSSKISFDDGTSNDIWGLEFEVSKSDDMFVKIIIANMADGNVPEYAMLVAAKDTPSYACYLAYDEYSAADEVSDRPMIACNIQNTSWAECSTYLQASFLCGMEKIREINSSYRRLGNEALSKQLIEFIKFYHAKMEAENEGQENQ